MQVSKDLIDTVCSSIESRKLVSEMNCSNWLVKVYLGTRPKEESEDEVSNVHNLVWTVIASTRWSGEFPDEEFAVSDPVQVMMGGNLVLLWSIDNPQTKNELLEEIKIKWQTT